MQVMKIEIKLVIPYIEHLPLLTVKLVILHHWCWSGSSLLAPFGSGLCSLCCGGIC